MFTTILSLHLIVSKVPKLRNVSDFQPNAAHRLTFLQMCSVSFSAAVSRLLILTFFLFAVVFVSIVTKFKILVSRQPYCSDTAYHNVLISSYLAFYSVRFLLTRCPVTVILFERQKTNKKKTLAKVLSI